MMWQVTSTIFCKVNFRFFYTAYLQSTDSGDIISESRDSINIREFSPLLQVEDLEGGIMHKENHSVIKSKAPHDRRSMVPNHLVFMLLFHADLHNSLQHFSTLLWQKLFGKDALY